MSDTSVPAAPDPALERFGAELTVIAALDRALYEDAQRAYTDDPEVIREAWEQLQKLPERERQRRLDRAHRVLRRTEALVRGAA